MPWPKRRRRLPGLRGQRGSPQYPNYVVGGDKKLSWKLPGSDVSLRIGGYAKLDAIGIAGGSRSVGASDQFNVTGIQTRGTPTGNAPGDPNTRIHGRIFVEASKTDTPFGPARAYVEADFFGPIDLGTETVSNSNTFRIRTVKWARCWRGTPGRHSSIRQRIRRSWISRGRERRPSFVKGRSGTPTISAAASRPRSRWKTPNRIRIGAGPVTGTGAAPAAGTALQAIGIGPFAHDSTPDFVGRIRYESPQFNLQLSGVGTRAAAPPATAAVPFVGGDGRFGFGVLASGQIALPLFNSKDNFRFQAGYLDGASRYLLDVSGSAPSVAYNETLTQFVSIKAYSAYGAVQHWWTDTIRSNFLYSFVRIDNPIFSGPAVIRETQYGVANLMYSPWPEVDVGVEFQYGQRTDADGRKGSQTRVQSSLIYRF
jgi:hypothetical protein